MVNGLDLYNTEVTDHIRQLTLPDGGSVNVFQSSCNSMYEILFHSVKTLPKEKTAVVEEDGREYSYSQLLELTDQFAQMLSEKFQIKAHDKIGLLLYNSIEFCTAMLAIHKLGAIAVPLATKYKESEIVSLINLAGLDLLITCPDFTCITDQMEQFGVKTCVFDVTDRCKFSAAATTENHTIKADMFDDAILMFTSGTTGKSKKVMLKNYNIVQAVISYQVALDVGPEDKTIIATPMYYVTGMIALFSLFLYCKGTIYLQKFFNAEKVLEKTRRHQLTLIHASPTVFLKLLEQKDNFTELPSLTKFVCGSGSMPVEKIVEIKKWLPQVDFRVVYGLTETSSPATIMLQGIADSSYIGSSGRPFPVNEIRIADDDDRDMGSNAIGEIEVRGATVIREYYENTNSQLFNADHWLRTGDIGLINQAGFLYIVDRKKDMINCGGEKVWSYDVENQIYGMEGIQEVAVVGIKDDIYGEVVGAAIVLKNGVTYTDKQIQTFLQPKLAKFQIPKMIQFVSELPKNNNTKIDKHAIKQMMSPESIE